MYSTVHNCIMYMANERQPLVYHLIYTVCIVYTMDIAHQTSETGALVFALFQNLRTTCQKPFKGQHRAKVCNKVKQNMLGNKNLCLYVGSKNINILTTKMHPKQHKRENIFACFFHLSLFLSALCHKGRVTFRICIQL